MPLLIKILEIPDPPALVPPLGPRMDLIPTVSFTPAHRLGEMQGTYCSWSSPYFLQIKIARDCAENPSSIAYQAPGTGSRQPTSDVNTNIRPDLRYEMGYLYVWEIYRQI
jgi:hypothetical protein